MRPHNFLLPAVLMEEATTTTPTLSSEAVTESYRWTFMFQVNFSAQYGNDCLLMAMRNSVY